MDKNYFGLTDTGKVRDNNEDTFIAEPTVANDLVIACVIDGVGGYSGGEIASGIARQSILQHLNSQHKDLPSLMKDAIIAADGQIMAEKQKVKAHENMACVLTLTVIDLQKNLFYYAHVGDTRLYLLRDGSLVKISKDQSFVGFMEDSGRLTEEQAMSHPKRNEINKALGFGAKIAAQDDYIETGQSPFLPGDLLLLCSDGLSDMVNRQGITDILTKKRTLQEKATELIQAANNNGGRDNITVVLVKNDKQSLIHEATKPAVKAGSSKTSVNHQVHTPQAVSIDVPVQRENIPAATPVKQKSSSPVVVILSILCLIFLGFSLYLIWQNSVRSNAVKQQKLALQPIRNAQETKLQDTINKLTGNTLVISDSLFKSPIILNEDIHFNKDTLFIIAKTPIIIRSDSTYKGSAVSIKPISKYVFLENITFENFQTAILSQNNVLQLKNVRFNNCVNSIEATYNLPSNKYIQGKIPASSFKTDSLPTPASH
nr:protein phosphatase 2C domain-containing protein [Pedobacter panaciterrae]